MRSVFLKLITVLALASLACTVSFNLPASQPGNLRSFTIDEAAPEDGESAQVRIEMAGGVLNISGGGASLVSGTVEYNLTEWAPEIRRDANLVRIQQNVQTIPIPRRGANVINRWDLQLGNTPMELQIDAGAYEGTLDLSGVPLLGFNLNSGASNTVIRFDSPNPEILSLMEFRTGASNVELYGLGNANFSDLRFRGAAGNYTLDFTGEMRQPSSAYIEGAVGEVTIIVPADSAVEATVLGGLRNIDTQGNWQITDNVCSTGGTENLMEIRVNMSVGNLRLISQ
jgi:hypothetical protein